MNIVILFYISITLIGVIHFLVAYRRKKKMQRLYDVESTFNVNQASEKLRGLTYGMVIMNTWDDIYRHIRGRNAGALRNNIMIVFALQFTGVFVNSQYVQISYLLFSTGVLLSSLVFIYLSSKKIYRQDFELGFAEALNIISGSVSAGNSLLQGISECGNRVKGVVGEEFKIVTQRLEIGEDVDKVFMDSYERLFYREYFFFIVAVLINMKGGGEVKEVINRLSKLISDSRIMQRRLMAKTAEPRSAVKVLLMIPVGFFFLLKYLSPENFDILLYDSSGQMVLYYAIISEIVGVIILWGMISKV